METSLSGIKKTAHSAAAASAGGRNSITLRDNRNAQPLQRKTVPQSVSDAVIQCAIDVQYNRNSGVDPLRTVDLKKLREAIAHTKASLDRINSPTIETVQVAVFKMYGPNPASTSLTNDGKHIVVRIAEWFLRQSSVGDLIGMLSHEIGVHTLADDRLDHGEKSKEDRQLTRSYSVRVGRHTHTIGSWKSRKKDWPRQRDHIIVARDDGGHQPLLARKSKRQKNIYGKKIARKQSKDVVNRRAEEYVRTMLRLGDAVEKSTLGRPEKDKRLHDLLNSFLLDYARILVTNDNLLWAAPKSFLIAQVFNWYKAVVIARHGDRHKWLKRKEMLPTASGWGVRAYLLGKIGRALVENALITPPAQFLGGRGKYYGGRLLGAISSGVSAITPGFVSRLGGRIANTTGSLYTAAKNSISSGYSSVSERIGPALRTVDHVYGEIESPIVSGSEKILRGAYNLAQWGWNTLRGNKD